MTIPTLDYRIKLGVVVFLIALLGIIGIIMVLSEKPRELPKVPLAEGRLVAHQLWEYQPRPGILCYAYYNGSAGGLSCIEHGPQ
jgi:hypothetical protein